MKHKDKVRIARSLPRSAEDDKYGRGMFDTDAWMARKKLIAARVARKQGAAHGRARKRKVEQRHDAA